MTADQRPIVAATPANGYVVHAARQPEGEGMRLYRGITLCGVRGLDANRWGGLRPYPEPRNEWQPFRPDIASDDRGATHPVCRACVRRYERITARQQDTSPSTDQQPNPTDTAGADR